MFFQKRRPLAAPQRVLRHRPDHPAAGVPDGGGPAGGPGLPVLQKPGGVFLFFPVERAAGRYDIIWRVTDKHVTVVTLSPFTVSGCPREDVVLLCSLANARLLNGTFYADPEGDRVMVSVTQRVFSTLQFGEKTIDYLLETLLARLDCRYMRSLESLCKGYTTLAQELDKLNGEG